MKYSISDNEENFSGEYDSKEEAIAEGRRLYEDRAKFYVGRNRDPKPLSTGIYADDILEKAQESLEDEWCCEWSIFRPSEEQVADLQVELQKAMDAWFEGIDDVPHALQAKVD